MLAHLRCAILLAVLAAATPAARAGADTDGPHLPVWIAVNSASGRGCDAAPAVALTHAGACVRLPLHADQHVWAKVSCEQRSVTSSYTMRLYDQSACVDPVEELHGTDAFYCVSVGRNVVPDAALVRASCAGVDPGFPVRATVFDQWSAGQARCGGHAERFTRLTNGGGESGPGRTCLRVTCERNVASSNWQAELFENDQGACTGRPKWNVLGSGGQCAGVTNHHGVAVQCDSSTGGGGDGGGGVGATMAGVVAGVVVAVAAATAVAVVWLRRRRSKLAHGAEKRALLAGPPAPDAAA